ncbi:hypothetical protein [Alicyclobacillus vulcanalis]|uniref:Uncharacterized protein n=1 Tax=Alicyclobacillus vulcanalis TaxID=252246 RepID=A0A1N7LYF9_9BACL|nr:hypothetical protein [Alicyclobacillus vulcanalis]SIS78873.1 hypothetical protein SAMN05421799_10478 [Alicyclobacillus vulcanalis]
MSRELWFIAGASFVLSVGLWAWRLRVPKGTRGRGFLTFFAWVGWLCFLSLAGYGTGMTASERGVNLLHILHIGH